MNIEQETEMLKNWNNTKTQKDTTTKTQKVYGDYAEDFVCKCGGVIDVYINWNNGDETPICRNRCEHFTNKNDYFIKWVCDVANGLQKGITSKEDYLKRLEIHNKKYGGQEK